MLSHKKTFFVQYVLFIIVFAVFTQIYASFPKDSLQLYKAKVETAPSSESLPFAWQIFKNLSTDQTTIGRTNQLLFDQKEAGPVPVYDRPPAKRQKTVYLALFLQLGVLSLTCDITKRLNSTTTVDSVKGGACCGTRKMSVPSIHFSIPASSWAHWSAGANHSCHRAKSPVHHRAT